MKRVFRKDLYLRDEIEYIPWWYKCDGVEVYPYDGLPNMYHAEVDGYDCLFFEDWCEEIADDE